MAVVRVGSARIDERGRAYGGRAGDQTGRELSTQKWYLHKKGWRVFRAKDRAAALKIAADMEAACKNSHIGYDQWQRNTLYKVAEPLGFDCAKVKTDCETDCSALVRVCCAYAGIMGLPSDFRTGNMPQNLLATGMFVELRGAKYTDQSAYLGKGDILVTRTHGHTVVVLDDGARYEGAVEVREYALGSRLLKHGSAGGDVKQLQRYLLQLGYDLGKWGADGEFGDATELAVRDFQREKGLDADGQYGKKTHEAMLQALERDEEAHGETVAVDGGSCYVRDQPGTDGKILGVVHRGDALPYAGETAENGWLKVVYQGGVGWISGKYGRRMENVGKDS